MPGCATASAQAAMSASTGPDRSLPCHGSIDRASRRICGGLLRSVQTPWRAAASLLAISPRDRADVRQLSQYSALSPPRAYRVCGRRPSVAATDSGPHYAAATGRLNHSRHRKEAPQPSGCSGDEAFGVSCECTRAGERAEVVRGGVVGESPGGVVRVDDHAADRVDDELALCAAPLAESPRRAQPGHARCAASADLATHMRRRGCLARARRCGRSRAPLRPRRRPRHVRLG